MIEGNDFILDYSNSNIIIKGDVFNRVGNMKLEIESKNFDKYERNILVKSKSKDENILNDSREDDEDMNSKDNYFIPEKADFDEEKMKSKFPGMTIDTESGRLLSDGSFKEYSDFVRKIEKIEINGMKLSLGSTGAMIGGYGDNYMLTFFKKVEKGDTVTIYSRGFETYKYFVK